jgi:hypothetical protein
LSWSLKHPKRYQDLKKLIDLSKKNEFLYFTWLKKQKDYRPWLVLSIALFQGIKWKNLVPFLESLQKEWHENLFALPEPSPHEISKILKSHSQLQYWDLQLKVPGIIWSVGAFVRKQQKSYNWCSESLAEIFYMGQVDSFSWKQHYLWFWLYCISHNRQNSALLVPNIPIQEYMRRFGPLKWKQYSESIDRYKYFTRFCNYIQPESPESVLYALHFYEDYSEEEGFTTSITNEKFS